MTQNKELTDVSTQSLEVTSTFLLSKLLLATHHRNCYLAQSVSFEASGLSGLVRVALLLVSLMVIFFFVWASYFTMDEAAHASGQVISASPVQRIQHLEGGLVQEILVQAGDIVQQGQILVRLDPQAAQTALNQMRAERLVLRVWQARLQAFLEEAALDFSAAFSVGDELPSKYDMGNVIKNQEQLLQAQRQSRESHRNLLNIKAERYQSEMDTLLGQARFFKTRIRLSNAQLAAYKDGLAKGATSRLDVILAKQRVNDAKSDHLRNLGLLAKARKERQETLMELTKHEDEDREKALEALSKVSAELSKLEEGMAQTMDRVERLEVRSPVHGIIQEMPVKTVRGVLAPGSLIAEIVPMGLVRYLEVQIRTLDVGHLALGQQVMVHVLAYDFARYGGIEGVLASISPTTFQETDGKEPYYKGVIRLHKNYVGNQPKVNEVLPGMIVQADIHTGSKTLMEYLLKPIYASMDKAFLER